MVLKQRTRKFDKLKVAFQETYLKFTCTDKVDVSTLKKKCGRIWACIEYAILEFVDISSFDWRHRKVKIQRQILEESSQCCPCTCYSKRVELLATEETKSQNVQNR
jgi:hypothetical protein